MVKNFKNTESAQLWPIVLWTERNALRGIFFGIFPIIKNEFLST